MKLEYLEPMQCAHDLPGVSKAPRVLISFTMAHPEKEIAICETLRCAAPGQCEVGKPASWGLQE
jgi:hypothetical protein